MEKVIINSYEDFEKLVGQHIGVSDYCAWLSYFVYVAVSVEPDY